MEWRPCLPIQIDGAYTGLRGWKTGSRGGATSKSISDVGDIRQPTSHLGVFDLTEPWGQQFHSPYDKGTYAQLLGRRWRSRALFWRTMDLPRAIFFPFKGQGLSLEGCRVDSISAAPRRTDPSPLMGESVGGWGRSGVLGYGFFPLPVIHRRRRRYLPCAELADLFANAVIRYLKRLPGGKRSFLKRQGVQIVRQLFGADGSRGGPTDLKTRRRRAMRKIFGIYTPH